AGRNLDSPADQRILLHGEILSIQKDRVQRGEVRLRKEVVTENQNVEVPVTREELVIERNPVEGREAEAGSFESGDKEIRVPLTEEKVRVEKKPVVTEEVKVGKRQVRDNRNVSDSVRHEEVRVEKEGDVADEEVGDIDKKKRRIA
ncbi:MAG TPA: YsnF/AvaK domain-containing protein, partial [Terriglobales bacterium]|nr:YsnF/AvaK domain-containing protein [Terriglobales bacterium]